MPHIDSILIRRFKSISELNLELDRVTVLVGTNNAGKSSVLQAIQFGVSAVQSLALSSTKKIKRAESGTLAADELVYTPLRDVQSLAQGGRLVQAESAQIEIHFETSNGDAEIGVRRGRNKNLTMTLKGSSSVIRELEDIANPFSAIAPGLAGIPPLEEYRAPGVVRRAAAYGDANSVFRNVLWILREDQNAWIKFQERMKSIFPDVEVDLNFDSSNDSYISATVNRSGVTLPIDASGTGILQAAQIFSYIGVYRPKLLILDEPDSHLHPKNQRQLIRLLDEVAEEDEFQVLLSTHSRHLLDECIDLESRIHWVDDGELRDSNVHRLPVLLALGALDVGDRLRGGQTSSVVLTEDSNLRYLKAILAANGFDLSRTTIFSYSGCTNLYAAKVLAYFLEEMAPGCEIFIHRDRDFLSEGRVEEVCGQYANEGFKFFITKGTDIESHFLSVDHLAEVYPSQTQDSIMEALARATIDSEKKSIRVFTTHRAKEANEDWRPGMPRPDVGAIAEICREEYFSNPERFRHGKETLKKFNVIASNEWGGARDVAIPTEFLRDGQFYQNS